MEKIKVNCDDLWECVKNMSREERLEKFNYWVKKDYEEENNKTLEDLQYEVEFLAWEKMKEIINNDSKPSNQIEVIKMVLGEMGKRVDD